MLKKLLVGVGFWNFFSDWYNKNEDVGEKVSKRVDKTLLNTYTKTYWDHKLYIVLDDLEFLNIIIENVS